VGPLRSILVMALAFCSGACSCLTGNVSYRPAPAARAPGAFTAATPFTQQPIVRQELDAQFDAAARNPERAFCMACLFPGGGHFYTGEKTRGAVILSVAAGSLLAGALLSGSDDVSECDYDPASHQCRDSSGRTPLWVGAGVAAGSWIFGIIDSRASAARVNARTGGATGLGLETRPLIRLTGPESGVGLHMRVTW